MILRPDVLLYFHVLYFLSSEPEQLTGQARDVLDDILEITTDS